MATNTTKTHLFDGDRKNRKQGIRVIPAKAESNKPGVLGIQSVSGAVVTDRWIWPTSAGVWRTGSTFPGTPDSDGDPFGGVATLDEAFDASGTPGVGIIDGATATGSGNCLRVGGSVAGDKVEIWHDGAGAHIHALTDDLYLSAEDGDIDFSSDNIKGVVNLTMGGTFTDGTLSIASGAITIASYNGLTIVTGTDTISLTRGAATIAIADSGDLNVAANGDVDFGTGTYNFDGDIDIASGKSVDINAAVTIGATAAFTTSGASAIDLNQDLGTTASPTFATLTCSTALALGDDDDINLGADGVLDSRIFFASGTSELTFWDKTYGSTVTLTTLAGGSLANPTVTDDLTITDGKLTWTDASAEVAGAWSFANTSQTAIAITCADMNTGIGLSVTGDSTFSSGSLFAAIVDQSGMTGEYYLAYDGTNDVFKVGKYGAVTIRGNSGTTVLDITAGNVNIDQGRIDVDTTQNIQSHFIRNNNTPSAAVVLIQEDHDDADEEALEIIHDPTGAINAMKIGTLGTGYGLLVDMGVAGGKGIHVTQSGVASGTAPYLNLDGSTGTAQWIGVAGTGMLQISSDGDLVNADTHLVQIDKTGVAPTGTTGASIHVTDASTTGGGIASAVYINSTGALSALHIAAGVVDIDTYMDIDSYVTIDLADSINQTALAISQGDTDGSNDGLTITFASDGRGLFVTNTKTDGQNAVFAAGVAATTVTNVMIDGSTANWIGGSDTGQLHVKADTEFAQVTGSLLLLDYEATATTKDDAMGSCLRITDQSSTGSGTAEFAMYIKSDNNGALYVEGGLVVFDDTLTMTGGADLVVAEGKLTVDSTIDETSHFKRVQPGVTSPVVEIEDTDTSAGTGIGLLIDVNGTGNSTCLQLSHSGDYPVIDIDAGAVREGNVIDIAMANMLAQTAIDITGLATGTASEGIIHVDVTGVLAGNPIRVDSTGANLSTGQLIYALSSGKQNAATDGICAYFADTGAETSSSSTVYITSSSNTALKVASGTSLFVDAVTCTAGQQSSAVAVSTDATKASAPIPVGTSFVTVTSGGTTEYLELPTAVVGNIIWLGAEGVGYQLAAADSTNSGEFINGGRSSDTDDDAWSQVTAGDTIRCVCTSSGKWIATKFVANGTESALTAAASS